MNAPVLHPFLTNPRKQMLIGGEWLDAASGRTFDSIDPATGKLLATLPEADALDVDRAVADSRRAFNGEWSRFSPAERQAVLLRLADIVEARWEEIARLETLDMGAPLKRTRGPKALLVDLLRYYAGQARSLDGRTIQSSIPDTFACTIKEPIGVVGGITPWNGPLWACVWKVGPVLATGCTMVLKPAEEASLSPLLFGQMVLDAGAPAGVLNIVTGSGAGAGAALSAHPDVDKVSFTGSDATGRKIVQASAGNLKRLTLELGGKSPNIIFADGDVALAGATAAQSIFGNSGQVCSAGTRVLVQRPVYEAVLEAMAKVADTLKVGPGLDEDIDMGPVVSARQLDRVCGYLDVGRDENLRLFYGGSRLTDGAMADGYFVAPTIFADASNTSRLAREEIFGPVATVIPFDTEDEALAIANDSQFALGAGVWTSDVGRAHRLARGLVSGNVWVNCYNMLDAAAPFGGRKASGYGHEGGAEQMDDYLAVKALYIKM